MIELPWQIIAATIVSFTFIVIVQSFTIRDKAEREHQRRDQTDRQTQKAIYEGIQQGFTISQQLHNQAHENSTCHFRQHHHDDDGKGSVS